jgi:hypothetical protein
VATNSLQQPTVGKQIDHSQKNGVKQGKFKMKKCIFVATKPLKW